MRLLKTATVASTALLVLMVSACSTTKAPMTTSAAEKEYEAKLKALQDREAALAAREKAARAPAAAAESKVAVAGDDLFPPNAKPGECYARIFVPGQYRTVTERVQTKSEGEKVEIIPAKYGTAEETVMISEESERIEVVPATYKTVTERVLVKPESKRLVAVPAQYETVTEKVLVREGYTTWKKGAGPLQRIDEATGEIMCLVEVPPEYKTITKTVMKTPPTTREEIIPAEYATVTKKVVDQPATTRVVKIPAQYKTVKTTKMIEPPQERRIKIPAEFGTVTRQEKVSEGRMEWREILCETNMTRDKIAQIQRALAAKGLYKGPIDGAIGSETVQAVMAFQKQAGLEVTRNLTVATVEALGVNPK